MGLRRGIGDPFINRRASRRTLRAPVRRRAVKVWGTVVIAVASTAVPVPGDPDAISAVANPVAAIGASRISRLIALPM